MQEFYGVWRDPRSDKFYRLSSLGHYEAQLITPEDISAIEAKVILDEVLGLAR